MSLGCILAGGCLCLVRGPKLGSGPPEKIIRFVLSSNTLNPTETGFLIQKCYPRNNTNIFQRVTATGVHPEPLKH